VVVADVDVVDSEGVAVDGLDDRLQFRVVAHGLDHEGTQLGRIVGIDGLVAEACFQGILKREADLLSHHEVGVVRLADGGVQQLVGIDERNRRRDNKHQRRDGENEFDLEAHGLAGRVQAVAAVLLEFVVERLEADGEDLRGAGAVLPGGFEGA